jgi:hypothetical protein
MMRNGRLLLMVMVFVGLFATAIPAEAAPSAHRGTKVAGCTSAPDGYVCLMVESHRGSYIHNARVTRGFDNVMGLQTICNYTAQVTITDPDGNTQYDWLDTSRANHCSRKLAYIDFWIDKEVPNGSTICAVWVDGSTSGVKPCLTVRHRWWQL